MWRYFSNNGKVISNPSFKDVSRYITKNKLLPGTPLRWTKTEINRFANAVRVYGKKWSKITKLIGTRNRDAVAKFHLKFL